MNDETKILRPTLQKYYSALKLIDAFEKENNFFDNISALDTFLSEYRSVTFALQKSIKGTDYEKRYKEIRDKYLISNKWAINYRNVTIHEHPFELKKQVIVTVFCNHESFIAEKRTFTIDDNIPIKKILKQIKRFFIQLKEAEVFFSARYVFIDEKDDETKNYIDVYEQIVASIGAMNKFMAELIIPLNPADDICLRLLENIKDLSIKIQSKKKFLVDDYIYIPGTDSYIMANRIEMTAFDSTNNVIEKMPVSSWEKYGIKFDKDNYFSNFVITHLAMGLQEMMPVFCIVYDDGSSRLDTYQSSIKTTTYRKIEEIREEIMLGDKNVKEVYYMQTFVSYFVNESRENVSNLQRQSMTRGEKLIFVKASSDGDEIEYVIDNTKIQDQEYTANCFLNNKSNRISACRLLFTPIIKAFKTLKESEN